MAEEERKETVVVSGDQRPSYGWLVALIVIAVLIILFFLFGGMSLFNSAGGGVDTGTDINVQPPAPAAPTGQ